MSNSKCVIHANNKISCIVEPVRLPFGVSNAVFNEVSYTPTSAFWANSYRTGRWNGKIYLYNYRNQTFPTGCMNRVKEKLIENDFDVQIKDCRVKPEPNENWNLVKHRWDNPDEDFSLRWFQKEAVEKAKKYTRGIFSLPTGSGKTTAFTAMIAEMKVSPVLVIVPTIDLLYQTKYEIENMLESNGEKIEVGYIGDSKVSIQPITICIINSALHAYDMYYDNKKNKVLKIDDRNSNISKIEKNELTEIQKYKFEIRNLIENAKMVICDESHRSASDMYKAILLQCNAYYRISLSATAFREDGKELEMEASFGRIVMEIPLKQMIEEDVLMDPDIYMVGISYDPEGADIVRQEVVVNPETKKKEKIEVSEWLSIEDWTYQDIYKKLVVENSELNNKIAEFASQFNNMGYSVLILVKEYAHGDTLAELIPNSIFLKGKDSSKVRKETIDQIKTKELPTLIATSIADMGLDIPTLDWLILAGSGGSDPAKYQKAGYKKKSIGVSKSASTWLDLDPVEKEVAEMMSVDATEGLDEVRFGGVIEQRIGRVLRKSPGKEVAGVIDFWFKNRKMKEQSKARKKVYLSRGLKVKMIK